MASVPRLRGKLHLPRPARPRREWATSAQRYRVRVGWHYARVSDNLVDLLRLIDGRRTIAEIAAAMSQRQHRRVHPAEVAYLLRARLQASRLITITSVPGPLPSSVTLSAPDLAPATIPPTTIPHTTLALPAAVSTPAPTAAGSSTALDEQLTQRVLPAAGAAGRQISPGTFTAALPAGSIASQAMIAASMSAAESVLSLDEQPTAAMPALPAPGRAPAPAPAPVQAATPAPASIDVAVDEQPTVMVDAAAPSLPEAPLASDAPVAPVAPVLPDQPTVVVAERRDLAAAPPTGPQRRRERLAAYAGAGSLPPGLSGVLAASTALARVAATPSATPRRRAGAASARPRLASFGAAGVLLLALAVALAINAAAIGGRARHAPTTRTVRATPTLALPRERILAGETAYLVRKGDTLDSIAGSFGYTDAALLIVNADILPKASALVPGMRLALPAKYRRGVPAASQPRPLYYIIGPGDTLSDIGQRFGLDWNTLASYNHIGNPDALTPGQGIVIPPASS